MKALAVRPGIAHSSHVAELAPPKLSDVPDDRGVLVRTLQVGVDATDAEIDEALYGAAPPGYEFLVLGHEVFGVVEEVGSEVTHVQPGDLCTCTVRRPGSTVYDQIGRNDITSDEVYFERGINLLHGFLTEKFVDDAEFIVKVPVGLSHLGVLSEPASVCAKGIEQAYLAQSRLQVWEPKRAFVTGAGQIGLLTAMMLRLRGLDVYVLARTRNPGLKEEIANAYGATYVSTLDTSIHELAKQVGKPDLIVEATGNSAIAFECMEVLSLNGALVWTSITGGTHRVEVPTDKINIEWVLGNKLLVGTVNGNRNHFEKGLADLALAEVMYPGVTQRILTHPVHGLENHAEIMRLLTEDKSALKVYVEVADL
ncbi:MAG: glucose 1-dehydrogenase [Planctomycetaceae bacterium]|nr:glucose 1-dehydrogenase [Planctomycetaceae bacterium]